MGGAAQAKETSTALDNATSSAPSANTNPPTHPAKVNKATNAPGVTPPKPTEVKLDVSPKSQTHLSEPEPALPSAGNPKFPYPETPAAVIGSQPEALENANGTRKVSGKSGPAKKPPARTDYSDQLEINPGEQAHVAGIRQKDTDKHPGNTEGARILKRPKGSLARPDQSRYPNGRVGEIETTGPLSANNHPTLTHDHYFAVVNHDVPNAIEAFTNGSTADIEKILVRQFNKIEHGGQRGMDEFNLFRNRLRQENPKIAAQVDDTIRRVLPQVGISPSVMTVTSPDAPREKQTYVGSPKTGFAKADNIYLPEDGEITEDWAKKTANIVNGTSHDEAGFQTRAEIWRAVQASLPTSREKRLALSEGVIEDAWKKAKPASDDVQRLFEDSTARGVPYPDGMPDIIQDGHFLGPDGKLYEVSEELYDKSHLQALIRTLETAQEYDYRDRILEEGNTIESLEYLTSEGLLPYPTQSIPGSPPIDPSTDPRFLKQLRIIPTRR